MPVVSRLFLAAVLSLYLASPASAAQQQVVDKIVAQVNGEMITLFDLNERVKNYVTQVERKPFNPSDPILRELQERMLKAMIEDILLKQEAVRLKVNISDAEVETRIRELREKGGLSEAQFVQQLRLEGMTRKQFADAIKRDILKKQLLGYMVQRKVVVTDEEIRAYFEQNKSGLRVQTGQRIGLIMLAKPEEAKALRQRIVSGQISFADAARKFSIGPGAEQGGDLGKVDLKDLAPELAQAIRNVPQGGVSEPVMLDGKPVLLTMAAPDAPAAAAQASGGPSYESVRDEIQDRLYKEKLEKQFTDYMDKLRAKSVIKINL
ncbi:Chaperone SurA [Fundidesulfovibrio magnetotacticus]|uniref:Chaperone SurA n=1 Tax=Fundidesulfovibrio magnetotacticus TaxID=2730080 RepID=A0A6V8M5H1_9BACT|nr:SurA N-terminal domain-containing protein [Fundidesulfovibrio magnetotacticus]GFK95805.1 Chaperone SurA [Fundidesulfovibrio magnetotacticus]